MKLKNILILSAAIMVASTALAAKKEKAKAEEVKRPTVCVWNFDKMVAAREDIRNNGESSQYYPAYKGLITQADKMLVQKPVSVMDKPADRLIKVDNPHDFVGASKYAHFIDGKWKYDETLPLNEDEYRKYDVQNIGKMSRNAGTLGLAYFFTGDERYAKKAVDFVYQWCVNPDTYMTPHFYYAQVIPGRYAELRGAPAGIIFGHTLVNMVAGMSLVKESKSYTKDFHEGLSKWIEGMYNWMDTSAFGKAEDVALNNHACAYDESMLVYALFLGKTAEAQRIVAAYPERRIFSQVEPNGQMPRETRRTRGYGYSWYNILHFMTMCDIAMDINPKLYYSEKDGRSIGAAIKFLIPYLGEDVKSWPYQQLFDWDNCQASGAWQCYRAASYEPNGPYMDAFNKVKELYPQKIYSSNISYITK